MNDTGIVLEQIENGIQLLIFNRPEALNTLNQETFDELEQRVDRLSKDPSLRVLLVTGAGSRAFVAGGDLRAMQQLTPEQAVKFAAQGQRIFRKLEQLSCPVIALVNGFALGGGCELALACDFILASDNARFGQPEVKLGITAGAGGTQRLPRRIGQGMAMELLLTGRMVEADEAQRIGLVNHIYPQSELRERGIEMARQIAGLSPNAVRLTKQLVHEGQQLDIDSACLMERQAFGLCFANPDQQEGMQAFLESRTARFSLAS